MKFSITRKINLSNIDRELWPYETEDLTVDGADSFEEATQKIDQITYERRGYYKALSEQKRGAMKAPELPKQSIQPQFIPAPASIPNMPATYDPKIAPPLNLPSNTGISNQPPAEFQ